VLGGGTGLVAWVLVGVGLLAGGKVGEEADGTAGAEGRGRAGWEGAMGVMVSVGWAGLAVVPGGGLRLAGLAGMVGGVAVLASTLPALSTEEYGQLRTQAEIIN
jgi:hypothetical protein